MIRKLFRKSCSLVLAILMVAGLSVTAFADAPASQNDPMQKTPNAAWEQIVSYANRNDVESDVRIDDSVNNHDGQAIEASLRFALHPEPISAPASSSGGGSKYYYNTGTSCPSQANYNKYNLLSVIKKGDVIFEANGGFGITGHIAIVEGIYSRNDGTGRKYIRLIEAISNSEGGVTRSILDDTRVDERNATILRVTGATSSKINAAVSFCQGELGSSYYLDFAKDHSSSETDWYCSELVWAAYYNQGIDIEVGGLHGEPGVTPRDIRRCKLTYEVAYSAG